MDPTATQNETAYIPSLDQLPEITIQFHTNFMALGVVCTIASMAIIGVFLYCCCLANRSQNNYDCSCGYERPITQVEAGSGSQTVISSSISFKFPPSTRRQQTFSNKSETIFEQSEEDESLSVSLKPKDKLSTVVET